MLAGAWAVLAVWTPSDDPSHTLCLFRRITHHDCATCGMTRALARLAKGDLAGSAARHPLAPPLAAEAVSACAFAPLALARGWRPGARLLPVSLAANLALLIGVWLVRLATGAL